ncbi:MAG: twin-arginine translocase subunit TatC [Alphaproteobacteria bacterium CG_4_10_14_0_2_um_filter_63_37]|nr:MAG: twin arginine-targeting protein translocase TatC [Proteobacteria bacterium CG1_02_64_396]PJA25828.1 MAG: twin-arginine translocase subunit TatC [Alphaproteobacteria bacterium CG_4_10_14_0_2_um_filter_63_37]
MTTQALPPGEEEAPQGQPLLEHLRELRKRIIVVMAILAVGVAVCFEYADPLYRVLMAPLVEAMGDSGKLIYTGLPEVFFTYLKVAILAAFILTSPLTFYQIWAFVAPGLYRSEKRGFLAFVVGSVGLFALGAAFAYFLVFPLIFKFFLGFANETIEALPAVKEYLSLVVKLIFAFGVAFEVPLICLVLAKVGILTPRAMAEKRRYVYVGMFVIGALLTPPDVISQVMLAIPMILLFEVGVALARWIYPESQEDETSSA